MTKDLVNNRKKIATTLVIHVSGQLTYQEGRHILINPEQLKLKAIINQIKLSFTKSKQKQCYLDKLIVDAIVNGHHNHMIIYFPIYY